MGKCANLIVQCMDYRIQGTINDWIEDHGFWGDIDVVSFGGSCKLKDMALQNIGIGCEKHGVKHVILTQHDDCAAYGGHGAFPSLDAERDRLIDDMIGVKRSVMEKYDNVRVTMLYVEEDGDSWKIVEIDWNEK